MKNNLLLKCNKNAARVTIGSATERSSMQLTDEQVQTISSMLPDEVIHSAYDYKIRKFSAAVFSADISGFTDLSEKFQSFENGASKLSMVLNSYLGSMVQEIMSHGGDIIKYAGDAFLAMFRAENELGLQEAIHKAINASIIIQKNCTNYRTEVGDVVLNGLLSFSSDMHQTKFPMFSVKLAISGGGVHFSLIGNEISSHYALVGDPVWQVKALQDTIKPGETLVTPKAWFYAREYLYTFTYITRNPRCYKIIGFLDDSKVSQRQHETILELHEMERMLDRDSVSSVMMNGSFEPIYDTRVAASSSSKIETYISKNAFHVAVCLSSFISILVRKSISAQMHNRSKKFLCRFIVAPVLNTINLNEPIEFLTEMRQVVIVFANFVVSKTTSVELIETVDKIYNTLTG